MLLSSTFGILCDAKLNVLEDVLSTQLEYTSPSSILNECKGLLKFSNSEMGIVNSIYQYFALWGFYLMLIMFLTSIINIMTKDTFTFEILMKEFLKFAIGIALIQNGPILIGGFVSLGNVAMDKIYSLGQTNLTAGQSVNNYKEYVNQVAESASIFDWLGLMLSGTLLFWICNILNLAIKVQFLTRKVEMLVRLSLTPISFNDLANGDFDRTNAIRYLKKIFALSLQGCAIIAVFWCVESITMALAPAELAADASSFDSIVFLSTSMVGLLCCVGATATTKQIVNDMLGC